MSTLCRPKTLKEYRRLQMKYAGTNDDNTAWQQLGSLGADLENEEVRKKREKTEKMHNYGQSLSEENQKKLKKHSRRPPPMEEEARIRKQKLEEIAKTRERAKEFSQLVSKPKVKQPSRGSQSTKSERVSLMYHKTQLQWHL